LILPKYQSKAAFTVSVTACIVEVCLMPENGSPHLAPVFVPHHLSIEPRAPVQRTRHTCPAALAAAVQPKAVKNPKRASCPDRASAFLQTALSDLLRALSLLLTPNHAEQLR
jgi:hypothetical protein